MYFSPFLLNIKSNLKPFLAWWSVPLYKIVSMLERDLSSVAKQYKLTYSEADWLPGTLKTSSSFYSERKIPQHK